MLAHADVHAERDLPADRRPVSVLPPAPAAMAELHQAQSQLQRLLRQGPAIRGRHIGPIYERHVLHFTVLQQPKTNTEKNTNTIKTNESS